VYHILFKYKDLIQDMQIKQFRNNINIVNTLFNSELITPILFCVNNVHK